MLLEQVVAPADALRRTVYKTLGPRLGRRLAERETRVALLGTASIVALFAATCVAPAFLLLWGPIVLGVPHVVADFRYLVVRKTAWLPWLFAAPALAATWIWPMAWVGLLGTAAALVVAPGSLRRRVLGIALALALAVLCHDVGYQADLVFAYLHNAIAIALFYAWSPRQTRRHLIPLVAIAAGTLALGLGAAGDQELARFLPGSSALVTVFAFTQAVHYLIWLRLVPDEDRPRPTPRSFKGTVRALRADLGLPILVGAVGLWLVILVWSLTDAFGARLGYLRASLFHGHLEVCAIALLWVAGRRPVQTGDRRS